MKNKVLFSVLMVILCVMFFNAAGFAQDASCDNLGKVSIAVLNIKVDGIPGKSSLNITAFIKELLEAGAGHNVLDSNEVYQAFKDAKFKASATFEEEYLVKAGNVLEVDKVITGSISKTDNGIEIYLKHVDIIDNSKNEEIKRLIENQDQLDAALKLLAVRILGKKVTGPVNFNSDPACAAVYFDDELVGETPCALDVVPEGAHKIRFIKKDYEEKEVQQNFSENDHNKEIYASLKRANISFKTFKLLVEDFSWEEIKTDCENDLRGVVVNSGNVLAVGDNGALLKSKDSGNTWTKKNLESDLTFFDADFNSDKNGYIVGGTKLNYLMYSAKMNNTGLWFGLIGTAIADSNLKVENLLYKTEDSGENYSRIENEQKKILYDVYFFDENNGYIAGTYDMGSLKGGRFSGLVLKTKDGGITWSKSELKSNYPITGVFAIEDCVWGLSETGDVFCSQDAGASWDKATSKVVECFYSIFFIDKNTGYIAGTKGALLKTKDGGKTWEKINSPSSKNLNKVSFVDGETGYVAGEEGIFATVDGGSSWIKMKSKEPLKKINGLYFENNLSGWAVGDKGKIFKLAPSLDKSGLDLYYKGVDLAGQGKLKEARGFLESAVELSPEYKQAYVKLAEVLEKLNLPAEAKIYKERAQKLK
ncbi:MAG: YCF48-related protein [Armatimonadota bacterium]